MEQIVQKPSLPIKTRQNFLKNLSGRAKIAAWWMKEKNDRKNFWKPPHKF
jgi:hypothetical protein